MTGWDSPAFDPELFAAGKGGTIESVELIGPHLRVSGDLHLGRFSRLSDLVNNTHGNFRLFDARLLRRNGDPTSLIVAMLMVNQDEITVIGQTEHRLTQAPIDAEAAGLMVGDRPMLEKAPRRFVVFTPGHAISGFIHVHNDMTIENFVDASDPRFIVMTAVSARSLADRRVISHFDFLLVNRTQIVAIAETEKRTVVSDDIAEVASG
jgi:hypothetical protein